MIVSLGLIKCYLFICSLGRTLSRASRLLARLTRRAVVGLTADRLLRALSGDLPASRKGPDANSGSESGPDVYPTLRDLFDKLTHDAPGGDEIDKRPPVNYLVKCI